MFAVLFFNVQMVILFICGLHTDNVCCRTGLGRIKCVLTVSRQSVIHSYNFVDRVLVG